ncbi:hypothetical protein VNI00_010362 [Paramarasmius palmivorus]|uniref:Anoctamin transmembrane domain-containing protein n=1 Tax=Paramarasmius palmivorus TaxID=297713 RepID=A0AAW0CIW4_9AGAR
MDSRLRIRRILSQLGHEAGRRKATKWEEAGLPFVLRRVEPFTVKTLPASSSAPSPSPQTSSSLVKRTPAQLSLPPYTPASDQLEMLTQFGYKASWPLAPVMGWVNDLLEGRGDAFKTCVYERRAQNLCRR